MVRIPLAIALLCVATALAHEDPLTENQAQELAEVRPRLSGALDAERAQAIRKALSSFSIAELREVDHHKEFRDLLDDGEQAYLRHALCALVFAADHEKDLKDPWPAALLLGSPLWTDWLEAIRLLGKEEFDKGLECVAVALALDPRLQVRCGAGRLAKALTRFRGPSSACTAIAKRLLNDPDPTVVAYFGSRDAMDFRDKEITDLAVARMRDRRQRASIDGLPAPGNPATVSYAITSRLHYEMLHRYEGKPLAEGDPDDVEAWWKRNREVFDYGPDPKQWEMPGVTWQGTLKKGEEAGIALRGGKVWFAVLDYAEYWGTRERPVHDARLRLRQDGASPDQAARWGQRQVEEDFERQIWSGGADGRDHLVEHFIAPNREGAFRVVVRIWENKR